jgi:hypothetical protein
VKFMLHAPTSIWSHMDEGEYLEAARALMESQRIADIARAFKPATQVRGVNGVEWAGWVRQHARFTAPPGFDCRAHVPHLLRRLRLC